MSTGRVRVVCNDRVHLGKVAFIDWLEFSDRGDGTDYLVGGTERLIQDSPVPLDELFGTLYRPPLRPPTDLRRSRRRHPMQCKLCGLRVEMRGDTATRIARTLLEAGVRKISLRQLQDRLRGDCTL